MGTARVLIPLAILSWVSTATAQSARNDSFARAPMQHGALVDAWSAEPLPGGDVALALGLHVRPQDRASATEDGSAILSPPSLSTAAFLATAGIVDDLDLSAGASIGHFDAADSESQRSTWGVARVVPRLRLFGAPNEGGAALLLDGTVPIGASAPGDGASLEPRVAVSQVYDWATMTLNAGYRTHFDGHRLGSPSDAVRWSIGPVFPMDGAWSSAVELAGNWYVQEAGEDWRDRTPTEARALARFQHASWAAELGGGIGLLEGRNEAGWRLFAAVSFALPTLPERHPGGADGFRSSSLADAGDTCAMALSDWTGGAIPKACATDGEAARQVAAMDGDCGPGAEACGTEQVREDFRHNPTIQRAELDKETRQGDSTRRLDKETRQGDSTTD